MVHGVAVATGISALLMKLLPPRRTLPEVSQLDIARWTGRVRHSLPPLDDLPEDD